MKKVSAGTIARTICLALALINQILTATGHSIIPIDDETINLLVSTAATIIMAIITWWKNNSFTQAAIEGDIDEKQKALDKITEELKTVKWEDRTEEQRKSLSDAEAAVHDARKKKMEVYESAAEGNAAIPQIIDIGLLGAGKLKGENLFKFLKRSVGFIK